MVSRSLRAWFVVHFWADMLFGVPLLVAPGTLMGLFGWTVVDPFTARLVGAALLGIGGVSLLARDAGVETYRTLLGLKLIWSAAAVVGMVVTLAQGDAPPAGWLFVGIFGGFFMVWAYHRARLGTSGSIATMLVVGFVLTLTPARAAQAQRYLDADGKLRVSLAEQPLSPNGRSAGPRTMATGGIREQLERLGARVRGAEAALTAEEETEYGGWKRLGMSLGHFADIVAENERNGWFTVGLLATCPSMPGLVAGLQRSGPTSAPLRVGMLWLDAHPDFNTPETTRSGSLGGMPVAVATGRALTRMRLDAKLDPALMDEQVVMGGVRLTDPLEQELLDGSRIQQVSVRDLQTRSAAVFAQLDRLSAANDRLYIHIDMDVLDPREVMAHGNKVPNGPSSEELAALFEEIFHRYPKASAIGFATIPPRDEGGLSIAALNRMILGAARGVLARERAAGR